MQANLAIQHSSPWRHRAEILATAIVLLVGAWFYTWTATSAGSPLGLELQKDDLYNRLAEGFLAGRLSFVEEPPPELRRLADPYDPTQNAPYRRYHDVSYYGGRYYLYFGPAPALVLLAPWKALTGFYLPQNLAAALLAWGMALMGVLLLRSLRRRYFPATPAWIAVSGATMIVFGSLLPILLRRPVYYELAIAGAGLFGMTALYLLHRAAAAATRHNLWLPGASLALGLAMASRPNYVFGAAAALGTYLGWVWRQSRRVTRDERWQVARTVLEAGLPAVMVGVALIAYNYARFGSWFEFGIRYQLAGANQGNMEMMSLRYVGTNLYYYLLAPPQFSLYFPFFQVTGFPLFALPRGYSGVENMYGLAPGLPFLLALWWLRRRLCGPITGNDTLRVVVWCGLALCVGNLGLLLLLNGANNRYLIDVVPMLVLLAATAVMHWEERIDGWRRVWGRVLWCGTVLYGVLFNTCVSLQHNELLRYHNPDTYRKIAHACNRWSEWLGPFLGAKNGPLRIELKFPPGEIGQLEPLVVTGLSFRADFLYVYYKDERHIQIGFEHTSYGGPLSLPIPVDYSVPHSLEAHMGSLYPPLEHPYFDGMPAGEIDRCKSTLLIKLDGRDVLMARTNFYDSSPGDVTVGRNTVSNAFGRRFSGVLQRIERVVVP